MAGISYQPLNIITDGGRLRREGKLVSAIQAALEGAEGLIGFVQMREQNEFAARVSGGLSASDDEIKSIAAQLLPICEKFSAKLIINRRTDLALDSGAHGVHLGSPPESIQETRHRYQDKLLLGYSAHSIQDVEAADSFGCDYMLFSPIFAPISKSSPVKPLGVKELETASDRTSKLLFALGGIKEDNVVSCLSSGASGVAMISSILLAPDPKLKSAELAALCREYLRNVR